MNIAPVAGAEKNQVERGEAVNTHFFITKREEATERNKKLTNNEYVMSKRGEEKSAWCSCRGVRRHMKRVMTRKSQFDVETVCRKRREAVCIRQE